MIAIHSYHAISFIHVKVPALVALAGDGKPDAGRNLLIALRRYIAPLTMQAQRHFALGLVSASQAPLQRRAVFFVHGFATSAPLQNHTVFERTRPDPGPSHVAHRSRQAVLRACSLAVETVEATTACATSK